MAYIHSFDPGASIVDFRDNASGWDPKVIRGDWEAMLTGLRAGQFKGAVAWHADRYTRQPAQLEQLISATDLGRAQLHTRMGGFHHDPTMIRIESALSWKESKVKSDRSKLKHGTLASEGKPHGGRRAYGWNEKRTKLIPHARQVCPSSLQCSSRSGSWAAKRSAVTSGGALAAVLPAMCGGPPESDESVASVMRWRVLSRAVGVSRPYWPIWGPPGRSVG